MTWHLHTIISARTPSTNFLCKPPALLVVADCVGDSRSTRVRWKGKMTIHRQAFARTPHPWEDGTFIGAILSMWSRRRKSARRRVTVHGSGARGTAIQRTPLPQTPPPNPPHNVADLSDSIMAGSSAATLRGGGHATGRERLRRRQQARGGIERMIRILRVVLLLVVAAAPSWAAEAEESLEDNFCVACHGNPDVWEEETKHLFVTADDLQHDIHWQKGIRCQDCHGGNAESSDFRAAHAEEDGFRTIETPADLPGFCGHCHSDMEAMRRFHADPQTDPVAEFWQGAHGMHLKQASAEEAVTCISCHPKHAMRAPQDPDSAVHPTHLAETCGACHQQQQIALRDDVHGSPVAGGNVETAVPLNCSTCHGENLHALLPVGDPASPVFANNQVETCGSCHEQGLQSYLDSVHGHGLRASGLLVTAVCASCHGAHGVYSADDKRSTVHVAKVASTCATCHRFIEERLRKSVHGRGNGPGGAADRVAPGGDVQRKATCTDCHQGHDRPHHDSARFRRELPSLCGDCHGRLSHGYGLSLHGELSELGYAPAADCADCHGSHDILPPSDPRSPMAAENRLQTCRKCHPSATANLVNFDPHADHKDAENYPLLHGIYVVLMIFLIGTFALFGLHSILWFVRESIHVLREGRPQTFVPGNVAYVRFAPQHRVAHALMMISFLGLAATGLPLKYSHTDWAQWLAPFLGGFGSTSLWHRIFGVVSVLCLVFYMVRLIHRLFFSRSAGQSRRHVAFSPDSPVPTRRDFKDFFAMLRWFFGLGPKPTFERWAYWEKVDFWGAAADSVIIGLTGLILWYPNLFCTFLPGETVNIAKVIHSTQALLATGFVFAIHFYSVWLRPDKFPLDMAMFTGVVSEEELRTERPAYYNRLREEGKLEQLRTVVPPRRAVLLALFAGYVALGIGTALLIGIVVAALTG
jgi:cytochrome b subunit of formate dehydrogenase